MKRTIVIVSGGLMLLVLVWTAIVFLTTGNTSSEELKWTNLGEGSLIAEEVNGEWYLRPASTVYLNMLGIAGKEVKLLTKDIYKIAPSHKGTFAQRLITMETSSIAFGSHQLLTADNHIFDVASNSSIRLNDDSLLINDAGYKNIWRVVAGGASVPLLHTEPNNQAKLTTDSKEDKEENRGVIDWAANPMLTGSSIVFQSNRDTAAEGNYLYSIYAMDTRQSTEPQLILSTLDYGSDIQLLGAAGSTVYCFLGHRNALLVYDLVTADERLLPFQGDPISLSPDGSQLLFRKVIDGTIQRNLYVLETSSGIETHLGMLDGYFYNIGGSWSADGSIYAFLLNGDNGNDEANGWYRTNIKIGLADIHTGTITAVDKPPTTSSLYQLGHLSWYEDYIITYTDDNQAWALRVDAVGDE